MDGKSSYEGKDVFPKNLSSSVQKLEYPENNFKFWGSNKAVNVFVLFMDDFHKIYFCKHQRTDRNVDSVPQIGKSCQEFESFRHESIAGVG